MPRNVTDIHQGRGQIVSDGVLNAEVVIHGVRSFDLRVSTIDDRAVDESLDSAWTINLVRHPNFQGVAWVLKLAGVWVVLRRTGLPRSHGAGCGCWAQRRAVSRYARLVLRIALDAGRGSKAGMNHERIIPADIRIGPETENRSVKDAAAG